MSEIEDREASKSFDPFVGRNRFDSFEWDRVAESFKFIYWPFITSTSRWIYKKYATVKQSGRRNIVRKNSRTVGVPNATSTRWSDKAVADRSFVKILRAVKTEEER